MPSDAANLLIATIGKLPLKSYLKSWERFSRLTESGEAVQPRNKRLASSIREIGGLKAGHTFQEGLTALIASAMSGSLQKFLDEALDPDEIVRMRFIQVAFHGPYPQAMISIRSDNAKPPFGLWLAYSDIPAEMAEVNEWSNKGFQLDESGDLSQSMNISARTIIGLGEFLRIEGAST